MDWITKYDYIQIKKEAIKNKCELLESWIDDFVSPEVLVVRIGGYKLGIAIYR